MSTEIERRFLLDAPPPGGGDYPGRPIRQGYLAHDGEVSVRVRDDDGAHTITVKGGTGRDRLEVETPIDGDRFAALWPLTGARRVQKTRRRVDVGRHVAEVDTFGGDLEGLVIAEVEFADAREADRFAPPDWFGTEITGEARWGNLSLATDGRPGP